MNDWFQQISAQNQAISASHISSRWHVAMDIADLMLARAFYQGTHLTINPAFGLKAAWIRQKLNLGIEVPTALIPLQNGNEAVSHNTSHSWGLGPRAALEADCLIGMGFRLQGDIAASLLFTRYTHIRHKENVLSATAVPSTLSVKWTDYDCLRPVMEMGLGLGWGSYFYGQKYHMDFSASYDFQIYWDQNMWRKLLDSTTVGVGSAAGNLHFHGLTLTARFDF